MNRFEGKAVIVTGAGSGIGAGTARRFLQEGAFVTLNGRREHKLHETIVVSNSRGPETLTDFVANLGPIAIADIGFVAIDLGSLKTGGALHEVGAPLSDSISTSSGGFVERALTPERQLSGSFPVKNQRRLKQ